jgi:hypothetical protein
MVTDGGGTTARTALLSLLLGALCGVSRASPLADLIAGRCTVVPVVLRVRIHLNTSVNGAHDFGPCTKTSATPMSNHGSYGATAQDQRGQCEYAYTIINTDNEGSLVSCERGYGLRPVHARFRNCDRCVGAKSACGGGRAGGGTTRPLVSRADRPCLRLRRAGAFRDEDGATGDLAAAHCLTGSMYIEAMWELGGPPGGPPGPPGADSTSSFGFMDLLTLMNTLVLLAFAAVVGLSWKKGLAEPLLQGLSSQVRQVLAAPAPPPPPPPARRWWWWLRRCA